MKTLYKQDLQVVSGGVSEATVTATTTPSTSVATIGSNLQNAMSSVLSTSAGTAISAAEALNNLGGQIIGLFSSVNSNIGQTLNSLHDRVNASAGK